MGISKQILREVIEDQRKQLLPEYAIPREWQAIMQQFLPSERIVIVSGLRRAGKSTLLQYIRKDQKQRDYYFNFDDERIVTFEVDDFQKLYELFIELYGEQDYFYFDEIQNIEGWERFVRRLHDYRKQIIITGSNARMLSQELGTHLTGRYRQFELFPFSFEEYLRFHHVDTDDQHTTVGKSLLQRNFNDYLLRGGIPGYLHSNDPQYLADLYEGIIYRDIVARHRLTKIAELKELVYHLASNIAKPITYGKLRQMLALKNVTTVRNYISYLQQSYLFFLVPKFDSSTKRQILAPKKLYCVDMGLARIIGFRRSADLGRLLENCVFLELRRYGYNIFYFQDKHECDFIIKSMETDFEAIQVTLTLEDPDIMKREINGLVNAMLALNLDHGLILTASEERDLEITQNNKKFTIKILPVWKWLLNKMISGPVDKIFQ